MEFTSFFSILFSLYCSANPGESKRLFRREKIFMDFLMICDIIALSLRPVFAGPGSACHDGKDDNRWDFLLPPLG